MNLAEILLPFSTRIDPDRVERQQVAPPGHVTTYEIVKRGRNSAPKPEMRGSKTRRGPYL